MLLRRYHKTKEDVEVEEVKEKKPAKKKSKK